MTLATGPKVLLALENDQLTDHFGALLRSSGYDAASVGCPEEARHLLDSGTVDLALIDVDWGAPTVAQLAEHAHQGFRPCPVAVVVGWWDARTGEVARCGDALVYKPPTQRQLVSSVRLLLESPFHTAARE
jgi:DNA-binding NtrC family response regulator